MLECCEHCGRPYPETQRERLTLKQRRLAVAIASGEHDTQRSAGKAAGYHHDTTVSQTLKTPHVQRAITRIRKGRRDKAQAIRDMSSDVVASYLTKPKPDPGFALAAFRESSRILEQSGDDGEEQAGNREHAEFRMWLLRVQYYATRAALDNPTRAAARLERLSRQLGRFGHTVGHTIVEAERIPAETASPTDPP